MQMSSYYKYKVSRVRAGTVAGRSKTYSMDQNLCLVQPCQMNPKKNPYQSIKKNESWSKNNIKRQIQWSKISNGWASISPPFKGEVIYLSYVSSSSFSFSFLDFSPMFYLELCVDWFPKKLKSSYYLTKELVNSVCTIQLIRYTNVYSAEIFGFLMFRYISCLFNCLIAILTDDMSNENSSS
jgi:hypothetical protein